MLVRSTRPDDVNDLMTAARELIGNQISVAAPWHGLGAHDCRRYGRREKAIQRSPEFGRCHVVGVPAELFVPPGCVRRVRSWFAPASQLGDVDVLDPVRRQ